jgi:aromatic ring-opening dioxygenase catalytic subunit (LigB family)
LFYEHYGFPEESCPITYAAPGGPELAGRIVNLLCKENIPSRIDAERDYDNGLFIRGAFPECLVEVCTGSDGVRAVADRSGKGTSCALLPAW